MDAQTSASERVRILTSTLNLIPLAKESGWIGLLGRSSQLVSTTSLGRPEVGLAAQSHNYYMLTMGRPINYLHWLESDDTHVLVEGGPVEYYIFHPVDPASCFPRAEKLMLGRDVENGHRPVIAVPGGCWKALRLVEGAEYALMVNVLTPEFTPEETGRVRIGDGRDWVERYRGKAEWATGEFLRGVIGPNWVEEG